MPDAASRIIGPQLLADADALLYVVPAATSIVVKSIQLYNQDTVTRLVTASIGADIADGRFLDELAIAASSLVILDLWLPLSTAETLRGHANVASVVNIMASAVVTT